MKNIGIVSMVCALIGLVPGVGFALVPNDTFLDEQWYLEQVGAFDAWDTSTGDGTAVVAILDAGVDLDHPDLAAHLWNNDREIPDDGIDNDQNGYVDDVEGWDFLDDDNLPEPDLEGEIDEGAVVHGTFVAGVIGAVGNNAKGIAGIAWDVQLMPLRILNSSGNGDTVAVTEAVKYAVANGADVINMSFTGFSRDDRLRDEIKAAYEAGVLVVAAVGNDGENGGLNLDEEEIYPACFRGNHDWVFGVASTNEQDEKAHFSNYGKRCTDISAPGVQMFGTIFQGGDDFTHAYGGYFEGTSVSAPQVSGAAALLKMTFPSMSPDEIRLALQLSVDPVVTRGTPYAGMIGTGRMNIASALEKAASLVGTAPVEIPAQNGNARFMFSPLSGAPPEIRVVDLAGDVLHSWFAYDEAFRGGVRIATGDVDGDGVKEVITAAGPGGGPHVRVFEQNGSLIDQFFAYDLDVRSGVYLTTADVDGNGVDEIVTWSGGVETLKVLTLNGNMVQEVALSGIEGAIAGGDLDGDGIDEVVAASMAGESPWVRVVIGTKTVDQISPYAEGFRGGVTLSVQDVDGDGVDEIVTGTGSGGGPHVRVFREHGDVLGQFFAFEESSRAGVTVGSVDVDQNGVDEIVAVQEGVVKFFDATGNDLGQLASIPDWESGFHVVGF